MNWRGHEPVASPGQEWDDSVYCRKCGMGLGPYDPVSYCPKPDVTPSEKLSE